MPRPVKRIELSERFPVGKLILVCLLLAVGILALGIGLSRLLRSEPGWSEIEVASGEVNCGSEFSFRYYLGSSGGSATAERKQVSVLYSSCCEEAYRIFNAREIFEDTLNLARVNENVNRETVVEPALYAVLQQVEESGSRYPYLAPLTECYGSLFASLTDEEAACMDPERDEDLAEWFEEAFALFSDPGQLQLELIGENTVRLSASEQLLSWAEQNGVTVYYDLFWMKNAFIADYIAGRFREAGLTAGVISSVDGFCSAFDTAGRELVLAVPTEKDGLAVTAAEYAYEGPMNSVVLYGFARGMVGEPYRYRYADGAVRTPYLSESDGICFAEGKTLVWFSRTNSCGELVLQMLPVFEKTGGELEAAEAVGAEGILCSGEMLTNTEGIMELQNVYTGLLCPNLIKEEL